VSKRSSENLAGRVVGPYADPQSQCSDLQTVKRLNALKFLDTPRQIASAELSDGGTRVTLSVSLARADLECKGCSH
jgi:hypothetical protein